VAIVLGTDEVIRFKAYVLKLQEGFNGIRHELPLVRERLQLASSQRNPRAHYVAYHDVSRMLTTILKRIPEQPPPFPLFGKPQEVRVVKEAIEKVINGGQDEIPLVNTAGTIFMGCFRCNDWIDVTKLFTERKLDKMYQCPNGHPVFFGSVGGETPIEKRGKSAD
jgi:hypothetical protein